MQPLCRENRTVDNGTARLKRKTRETHYTCVYGDREERDTSFAYENPNSILPGTC